MPGTWAWLVVLWKGYSEPQRLKVSAPSQHPSGCVAETAGRVRLPAVALLFSTTPLPLYPPETDSYLL